LIEDYSEGGTMNDTMLAALIKERMRGQHLSLRKAAEEIGISHPTLARILDGEPYTVETAQKIASWLGVQVGSLVDPVTDTPDSVARGLASILAAEPKLLSVFAEALRRVNAGEMDMQALKDLLSYAAFRLGQ
jgi:transcriptional regulator with XRE-family HTH domain